MKGSIRGWVLLAVAAAVAAGPVNRVPADIMKIAAFGGQAPGVPGGTFSSCSQRPVIGGSGQVAFYGIADSTSGVWLFSANVLKFVAVQGDSVPGVPNATFVNFNSQPAINASGVVAFGATYSDGSGIFLASEEGLSAICLAGQSAPRVQGGTDGKLSGGSWPTLNNAGDVAFGSYVYDYTYYGGGLFRRSSGQSLVAVARIRDEVPGTDGELSFMGNESIDGSGGLIFTGTIDYYTGGIFFSSYVALVLQGQQDPSETGEFYTFNQPWFSDNGLYAFRASVNTGSGSLQGIFGGVDGELSAILWEGDTAPVPGGGVFRDFKDGKLGVNNSGQISLLGNYSVSGGSNTGVFRIEADATVTPIALPGQTIEGLGTYLDLQGYAVLNASGVVAYYAVLTDGRDGIFLSDGRDTVPVILEDTEILENCFVITMNFAGWNDVDRGGRSGINDLCQVAFWASWEPYGAEAGIFLFTPDLNWRKDESGVWHDGDWEDTQYWIFGIQPTSTYSVRIRPADDVEIMGPTGQVAIKSLELSGEAGGDVHLDLSAGGTLTVTGDVTIREGGKITLASGSTLVIQGKLIVDGGEFVYGGGTLNVAGTVEVNGEGALKDSTPGTPHTLSVGTGGITSTSEVENTSSTIQPTITFTGNAAITVTGATHTLNMGALNAGAFTLTKAGEGTLAAGAVTAGTLQHVAGTLIAGAVQANVFNVNASATIASLTGTGTTPSALVAEGQTMSVGGGMKGLSSLTVNGTLLTSQTTRSTIDTASLTIGENGQLDLKDGFLAINYDGTSPLEDVVAWIKSGFNGLSWDGKGIISSAAAADPGAYAVGWAEASVIQMLQYEPFGAGNPFGDFEDIDDTTILVRFTLVGDINLDGTVDDIDISILTGNYLLPGTWGWADGDVFMYDGTVDDNDVGLQAGNYLLTVP